MYAVTQVFYLVTIVCFSWYRLEQVCAKSFRFSGLVARLLQLLQTMSLTRELEKLEMARAISEGKHRAQVTELVQELLHLIAECLFAISCQRPLTKESCVDLINFLKAADAYSANGSLESLDLYVLMSLLANFNASLLDQVLNDPESEICKLARIYMSDAFLLHKQNFLFMA